MREPAGTALTLADLAGSYSNPGDANSDATQSTIAADGSYNGANIFSDGSGSCSYAGTVDPSGVPAGLFTINVTMGNEAACGGYANQVLTGIGTLDSDGLSFVAHNTSTSAAIGAEETRQQP